MTSSRYVFIASCLKSLEDFLKTDIAKYNYIHCTFKQKKVDLFTQRELRRKGVVYIGFTDTKDSMRLFMEERKLTDLINEISALSIRDRRYLLNFFNKSNDARNNILTEEEYDLLMSSFHSEKLGLNTDIKEEVC